MKSLVHTLGSICYIIVTPLISAFSLMLIWNWYMPKIYLAPAISFSLSGAFGLVFVASMLRKVPTARNIANILDNSGREPWSDLLVFVAARGMCLLMAGIVYLILF